MSSLDGIFTLQPEELFEKSTLERISDLSNAEAIALLPAIDNILTEEIAAWADHCAIAQSISYAAIVAQVHAPGADAIAIKAMAAHHVLETMPARFAILDSKSRSESQGPLPEVLAVLRYQMPRYGTRGGVEFMRVSQRRSVYDYHFAKAVSELEATMTGLENSRMEQLMRVHMLFLGVWEVHLTSTKHVAVFVRLLEELGMDFESIVPE